MEGNLARSELANSMQAGGRNATCRVESPEKCLGYQLNDLLDRKIGRV